MSQRPRKVDKKILEAIIKRLNDRGFNIKRICELIGIRTDVIYQVSGGDYAGEQIRTAYIDKLVEFDTIRPHIIDLYPEELHSDKLKRILLDEAAMDQAVFLSLSLELNEAKNEIIKLLKEQGSDRAKIAKLEAKVNGKK